MTRALWVVLALMACGHARPGGTWTTSGVDWSAPPRVPALPSFSPPDAARIVLGNGVQLIVIENHRLPVVAITAVHADAGAREDGSIPGLAALTADLLDEGAGTRSAAELAEAIERAGARLDIYVASDYASMQLVTTAEHTDQTLELLADMIRRPKFTDSDVTRVRARRAAEVSQRRDRPRTVAAQMFDRLIYGSHPYALPAEGTVAGLSAIRPMYVLAFWLRAYRPDAMTLIVAGDVKRDQLRASIEHAFGDWKTSARRPPPGAAHTAIEPQLGYVDLPGASESIVLIGRELVVGDPQRIHAEVANSIVGGGLGSRLDHKLHDELNWAVGPSTSFWRGQLSGTWTLAATFDTAKTSDGIRAALAVIDGVRASDVTADELARAKTNLARGGAQAFATMTSTARAFERLVVQGLPITWYASYAEHLAAVGAADVRAVAQAWSKLTIVVVGDWAKIGAGVTALGLPIERFDRDGNRVK